MKNWVLILTIIFAACVAGVAAYTQHYNSGPSREGYKESTTRKPQANYSPQSSAAPISPNQAANPQEEPPPPPPDRNDTPPLRPPVPDAPRTFVGTSSKQIADVTRYLPYGTRVYSSAVGAAHLKAAIARADLDGDSISETVVVHSGVSSVSEGEPAPLLFLSILSREGEGEVVRQSIPLIGGVLFNIKVNGIAVPLVMQDVTGDGRPEIIVASGGGASVGGQLQVFDTDGRSISKMMEAGGHFFSVQSEENRKPALLKARWKDENETTVYHWNGREFESGGESTVQ